MSYMTGEFPVMVSGEHVGKVTVTQNGLMMVFECACEYRSSDVLRLAAVCQGKYVPLGVMTPSHGVLRMKRSFTKNALHSIGYYDPISFHLVRHGDVYREQVEGYPGGVLQAQDTEIIVYNDFPDPTEYIDYFNEDDETEEQPAPGEKTDAELPPDAAETAEAPEIMPERQTIPPETIDIPESPPVPEPTAAQQEIEPETPYASPAAPEGWYNMPTPGILFEDRTIRESCENVSDALVKEQDGYLLLAVPVRPTEPFPMMPVFCFGASGQIGGQEYIVFKIIDGYLAL